eukprot:m.1051754 g.1051754  ORF g.1051754 m.1051754 type:complete len:76 (-) comp24179_c0_seq3:2503-2730(-)
MGHARDTPKPKRASHTSLCESVYKTLQEFFLIVFGAVQQFFHKMFFREQARKHSNTDMRHSFRAVNGTSDAYHSG